MDYTWDYAREDVKEALTKLEDVKETLTYILEDIDRSKDDVAGREPKGDATDLITADELTSDRQADKTLGRCARCSRLPARRN